MAPRKGLSFDEKRERLLELFGETADFFTLKELEKIASKRKGIGKSDSFDTVTSQQGIKRQTIQC